MLKVGLTGSIATGKSYIADLFRKHHVPVLDSDAYVQKLYSEDKSFLEFVKQHFPEAIVSGHIDRALLGRMVFSDKDRLDLLESFIHPKIAQERAQFVALHRDKKFIVFDIPLLYEKDIAKKMDLVVCTYCDSALQKARALKRDKMNAQKLDQILEHQLPQSKKIKLADFAVDTGESKFKTFLRFKTIMKRLEHLHLL